jgi:hypothetical protein
MKRTVILLMFLLVPLFLPPVAARGDDDTFTLQGVVSGISGEPVKDAELYVYGTSNTRRPADFISPKTGSNGAYRLVLPKKVYWGVARIKKGERYGPLMPGDRHSGEPVRIDPETDTVLTLDFTVADMQELAKKREKGRDELIEISGTVTRDGKAAANAYVFARVGKITATLPEYFSGWTDDSGIFSIKLPPGHYHIGCETEFPPAVASERVQEIDVTAGKLPVAISLQLPLR